jgi:hypothetical protein
MATPNLQLVTPPNNSDVGTWDQPVNQNSGTVDAALGSLATLNAQGASGTIALTTAQFTCANLVITGTPAAAVTYQLPAGAGRFFFVDDNTGGAPLISFASASGGAVATIPKGAATAVVIDPVNGARLGNTVATTAGGVPGEVQINVGGALAGDTGLTYSTATQGLTIGGPLGVGGNLAIGGVMTSKLVMQGGGATTQTLPLTFAASAMAVDCSKSNVFSVILTASLTGAPALSNMVDGQTINVRLQQDTAGARTAVWPSSFRWAGGAAGVLSTTANAVDLLVATYFGASQTWLASLLKGFA